jgi:hypothetical protein
MFPNSIHDDGEALHAEGLEVLGEFVEVETGKGLTLSTAGRS